MTTKKNHKVLFISRAYGEHAGGMERLSFELIEAFENSDIAVEKIVNETKPGISLLSTRLSSILFVLSVLPRALKQSRDADVLHIGDPVLSFIGWVIMRVRNIPVAVTVHGLDVAYANPLYQLYLKLFFQKFSAYIPISTYAKKLLEKHPLAGAITIIPPGVRDHLYDASKTKKDLEKLLQRDVSNTYVLATTGRLVQRKGHAWLIENVLPKLPENVVYAIAGSGPEAENLTRLVHTLQLQDRVLLLGRISNDDQKTLLNTMDAFIQPNIHITNDAEGFGIAPLEAALCGKAVFAADIDGIPSAIHNGKNGTLLPAEDVDAWIHALTKFLINTKAFAVQGEPVRNYTLATFTWNNIAEQYEEVFTELYK